MFVICGYDFCADGNSLNPAPILVDSLKNTTLRNGVFDQFYATRDVDSPYSSEQPTAWEYLTVMDANFNGDIEAGNLAASLDSIEGFKIKRRKVNEFDWVTLTYIPKEESLDLSFVFQDNLAQSEVEYEYAFVPIVGGIEGNYVSNTLKTKFDGVFICDADTIYRFYSGVSYGTQTKVQKIGVFEPFGKKYPVVVSNGVLGYNTGSLRGDIINPDFYRTKALDRIAMVKQKNELLEFLTNKRAKVIKDWNGNIWLCFITNSPTVGYNDNFSMGLGSIDATWTEIGDANNHRDLYNAGMVKEIE